jgi:hypothetical protein
MPNPNLIGLKRSSEIKETFELADLGLIYQSLIMLR